MVFLGCNITETGRNRLGKVLFVMHVLQIFFGTLILILGGVAASAINKRAQLIEGYNTKILGGMAYGVGFLMWFLHGFGAKFSFSISHCENRGRFKVCMLPFQIILFVHIWVVFSLSMKCFHHSNTLKGGFEEGFLNIMDKYKSDFQVKQDIDNLQIKYQCCGSTSHSDWYKIKWIPTDLIPPKDDKAKYPSNDAIPFSCCDPYYAGPCFHYKKSDKAAYYDTGCAHAISLNLIKFIYGFGTFVLIPWGLQMVITLLTRYLCTSIESSEENDEPEGDGLGYILDEFPCCPKKPGEETGEDKSRKSSQKNQKPKNNANKN